MKNLFFIVFQLMLLLCVSCVKNDSIDNEMSSFSLDEAQQFFVNNAVELKLLPVIAPMHKHENGEKCEDTKLIVTPNWVKAIKSEKNDLIQYEIPLKTNVEIGASLIDYFSLTDQLLSSQAQFRPYLVIEKNLLTGSTSQKIITIIGRCFEKSENIREETFTINGRKDEFKGFIIHSDLSGNILASERIIKGVTFNDFPILKISKNEATTSFFGYVAFIKNPLTKDGGSSYTSGCPEFVYCSICEIMTLHIDGVCERCQGGSFPEFCPTCHNPSCTWITTGQCSYFQNTNCDICGRPGCTGYITGECVYYCIVCGKKSPGPLCGGTQCNTVNPLNP